MRIIWGVVDEGAVRVNRAASDSERCFGLVRGEGD